MTAGEIVMLSLGCLFSFLFFIVFPIISTIQRLKKIGIKDHLFKRAITQSNTLTVYLSDKALAELRKLSISNDLSADQVISEVLVSYELSTLRSLR